MEPTRVFPMIVLLSLITVEYGGWALLGFLTGHADRRGPDHPGHRPDHTRMKGAGHATVRLCRNDVAGDGGLLRAGRGVRPPAGGPGQRPGAGRPLGGPP